MKTDPTLFAYFHFKNIHGKPFTAFSYQDIILNDESKTIAVCIARQSGKSTMAAIKALHAAYFNDNYVIVIISGTKPQSMELIKRMRELMHSAKFDWSVLAPSKKESRTEIVIKNKNNKTFSRIICVPATDGARGYTANLVIIDEAAFIENGNYIFNSVARPMVRFTKGQIILLSTPNGKRGFFWNSFNSKYWSTYQFDWRVCPVNTEEEMQQLKEGPDAMTTMQFNSEYEAKFVSSQNAYFTHKDIQNAISEDAGLGIRSAEDIVVGVDFGKVNDQSVILIGKFEDPMALPQDKVIVVIERIVKPLGTNYGPIIGELKSIWDKYHPRLMVLDATGVGEAPADLIKEYGANAEALKFSLQKKESIYTNLKIFFEQGRIKIPNVRDMIDQLEILEYTHTDRGNLMLHAPSGAHDDECDALACLVWGMSRIIAPPASLTIV